MTPESNNKIERWVRHLCGIMVWPLQLMPMREDDQIQNHWEILQRESADNPWHEVDDEFGKPEDFQERHYNEFVAFLPYAQRMIYGEGKGCGSAAGESPIHVLRRSDIARARVTFPDEQGSQLELAVKHVDLYFFHDLDVAILAVEVSADELSFERAHEVLFRLGRSYPTYWDRKGRGGNCFDRVEWLDAAGRTLASSDYERRDQYLAHVCRYRTPRISSHWEYLLQPLVPHHSDRPGSLRYRLVEYHRMPVCGFMTLDDPSVLTRADFMRLALLSAPGSKDVEPLPGRQGWNFEQNHCYDRFWGSDGSAPTATRSLCSGEAFVMVAAAQDALPYSSGPDIKELFRHQYFLVFLMSHLHKAALLMMADRLLHALNRLAIDNTESVRHFKRDIRQMKEIFLRFTHRYWHHELSDQLFAKALYRMNHEHLGTERLYSEVRDEIHDMSTYLDSDSIRRQANMVIRLTVVTIFGLIGTVATGVLGMNLFAEAESPAWRKILIFFLVFLPTIGVTIYTIIKSKRLADFLDALSDDRLPARARLDALIAVWKSRPASNRAGIKPSTGPS